MKLPKNVIVNIKLFLLFIYLFSNYAYSQFSIEINSGVQIPGKQDLKFKYIKDGELIIELKTTEVNSTPSPFYSMNVGYWFKIYNLNIEFSEFSHTSTAKHFITNERPPFVTIEQYRKIYLFNVLRKFRFPFKKNTYNQHYYSIIGIGIGQAYSSIQYSKKEWRGAFQIQTALSFPISKNLKGNFKLKYLLTMDVDIEYDKIGDGWHIDTSGHWHLFRFGPHWDTKYHVIQFGIQYNFHKTLK